MHCDSKANILLKQDKADLPARRRLNFWLFYEGLNGVNR